MLEGIQFSSVVMAALVGSGVTLLLMYFLLPALGLPRLDYADITAGWVGVKGRAAKAAGVVLYFAGGVAWTYLYARFFPWHGAFAGMTYGLIPFVVSSVTVMRQLNKFRVLTMPGFVWRVGGPQAVISNLVEHLVFGLVIGFLYAPK